MRPPPPPGIRFRRFLLLFWAAVPPLSIFACGSRTALPAPDVAACTNCDAQAPDTRRPDAARDAIEEIPPIDARLREASRDNCPDGDATLIYVVTESNELLAFNPPAASFRRIGLLTCPVKTPGSTPFSMAVDRTGVAYVLFNDGNLYRVSTLTAACDDTPFARDQAGFRTFGMGFSADQGGPTETLYIASDPGTTGADSQLATIDLTDFSVDVIGTFFPMIFRAELTGTGGGGLYAFHEGVNRTYIAEVDKQTAQIVGEDELPGVSQGQGWAFAYWGGDFYTFTSPGGGASRVTRFRPTDKSITVVGSYPQVIVGAGVSTCAPQQ